MSDRKRIGEQEVGLVRTSPAPFAVVGGQSAHRYALDASGPDRWDRANVGHVGAHHGESA